MKMAPNQALIRLAKIKEAVPSDVKPMVDYVTEYVKKLTGSNKIHLEMTLDFSEHELQTGSIVKYDGKLWKVYVHDDGIINYLPEFNKTAKVTLMEYEPTELKL